MSISNIEKLRQKFFPFKTAEGFLIQPVTESELNDFVKRHFSEVFPDNNAQFFQVSESRRLEMQPMMQLYKQVHHERFLFYDSKGTPVGWHMGECEDTVTFYLRNTGILPNYRRKGLYTSFSEKFEEYLKAIGYERLTSHHQVTNRAILITKLKAGFSISGMELTERWGPLVKVVKLLREDRKESFYSQFGMVDHMKDRTD